MFTIGPDALCPYSTHSWPLLCEPWRLQTVELLPAPWPEYGIDRGHPGGVWITSFPSGLSCPLLLWCGLPEDVWRSCTLWEEIHSITIFSIGFSCCIATQSITCKFTHVWAAHLWTAVSSTCWCILSSASATVRSWALPSQYFLWGHYPRWTSELQHLALMQHGSEHLQ